MNHREDYFLHAGNILRDNKIAYIPEKFKKEIQLHIYKNIIANYKDEYKVPLILAISGPPGVGKTYQVCKLLDEMKINVFNINGSEFENKYAGEPSRKLIETYLRISEDIKFKKIENAVILIDDADSALGNWGNMVQYTMNRQLTNKVLIDLCDSPKKITYVNEDDIRETISTNRIPIILTLNDETKMYPPLMRPGRTTSFHWIPDKNDTISIVQSILCDLDNNAISFLYDELYDFSKKICNSIYTNGLPISLFSDIKTKLLDDMLLKLLETNDINKILENYNLIINMGYHITLDYIIEIGKNIMHSQQNFLEES